MIQFFISNINTTQLKSSFKAPGTTKIKQSVNQMQDRSQQNFNQIFGLGTTVSFQ